MIAVLRGTVVTLLAGCLLGVGVLYFLPEIADPAPGISADPLVGIAVWAAAVSLGAVEAVSYCRRKKKTQDLDRK